MAGQASNKWGLVLTSKDKKHYNFDYAERILQLYSPIIDHCSSFSALVVIQED